MSIHSKLRVGLVGAGWHGRLAVVPSFHYSQHASLIAVADTNPDNLNAITGWQGNRYSSVSAMLADEKLDALYIATLPCTHAELALEGLRSGLHIICEKPMAATQFEAQEMVSVAEAMGKEIIVMFENRFHPAFLKIGEWIESGSIGRVEAIHIQTFGKHPVAQPRRTHLLNAAGSLDCGIHMLDLVRFWTGSPEWEQVHALGTWFGEAVDNPPHVGILARLTNGVMVTFENSFSWGYGAKSLPNKFRKRTYAIVGTEGVITDVPVLPEEAPATISFEVISDRGRERVGAESLEHDGEIAKVVDRFAQELSGCLPREGSPLARGIDGLLAQQIVDEVNTQSRQSRLEVAEC